MVSYPIRVHVKRYEGTDQRRLREFQEKLRVARAIEEHIYARMRDYKEETFMYRELADKFGSSEQIVRELLSPVGGGYNGITVRNPEFSEE